MAPEFSELATCTTIFFGSEINAVLLLKAKFVDQKWCRQINSEKGKLKKGKEKDAVNAPSSPSNIPDEWTDTISRTDPTDVFDGTHWEATGAQGAGPPFVANACRNMPPNARMKTSASHRRMCPLTISRWLSSD